MRRVFFIQQNFTVGDIAGNTRLLLAGAEAAAAAGAAVALSPELSLTGYPTEDLLYYPAFQSAVSEALADIVAHAPPEVALIVGLPRWEGESCYNACVLVRGGRVELWHNKNALPNYSVFDERRYFTAADHPPSVFSAAGETFALQICEELWSAGQAAKVAATGAQNVLALNGSPFFVGKQRLRRDFIETVARQTGASVFYANAVGGQDELVFDGASFVVDGDGVCRGQLPAFAEYNGAAEALTEYPEDEDAIYAALKMGLADYLRKTGFAAGVLLGLSGGVDSALVATLAAEVAGADKVTAVMLPTEFTSAASLEDARQLAKNLGVRYREIPLTPAQQTLTEMLTPFLTARENDVTLENLQARLRGTLLMAISNHDNLLLLATGNKSEMACGYATLYGDMNGGFAPIKDVLKTQVWALCRRLNRRAGYDLIPDRIITRPPSAELAADQTDQDTLPPYADLDAMLSDYLSRAAHADMRKKYGDAQVADFYRRLTASEYKRRQAPIGTKVSDCAFGRDWRMPIANGFRHR